MKKNKEVEILIVEDDPHDQELITRVLKKHNLAGKLFFVADGAEALDFSFAEGDYAGRDGRDLPRVVVLDLKLPKVSGIEVLRRLRSDERTRKIPVVILTSSKEDTDVKDAYSLGANSYIAKPVNFGEFAQAVSEIGRYWLTLNRSPAR